MHKPVLLVVPLGRIVQTAEDNGRFTVGSGQGQGNGSKGIVVNGQDQVGPDARYIGQGEIAALPDGGFASVLTFRAHIKMLEHNTPVTRGMLSESPFYALELRGTTDIVRAVAVNHENPGRLVNLLGRG
jgi:hypothetical protein